MKISLLDTVLRRYAPALLSAFLFPVLPACSGDTPDEPVAKENIIQFSTPVVLQQSGSRANLVSGSLPEATELEVYGYCIPLLSDYAATTDYDAKSGEKGWNAKKSLIVPDVLDGARLEVDAYGCYYKGEPGLWYTPQNTVVVSAPGTDPSAFKYSFMAFCPASDRFRTETAGSVGAPTLHYTVEYPCKEDAMYAFVTDHMRDRGAVDLVFHHILSAVSVKFNNYSASSDIVINSLVMEGDFYSEASIDFSEPDPAVKVNSSMTHAQLPFVSEPLTVPHDAALTAPSTYLILANSAGTNGSYLGARKTIVGSFEFEGQTIDIKIPREGDNFDFGRVPQPGVNYTLNINFYGDRIVLMFTADNVEYWQSGSDNNIFIN